MSTKTMNDAHDHLASPSRPVAGILAALRALWQSYSADCSYQCRYQALRAAGLSHAAAMKQAMNANGAEAQKDA